MMDHKAELERVMIDLARKGADCLALISECWTLAVNSDDAAATKAADEYSRTHSLKDHPDHKEILMVMDRRPATRSRPTP